MAKSIADPNQLMGSDRSSTRAQGKAEGGRATREEQATGDQTEEPSIDDRDEGRCRANADTSAAGR
jgi:hypothetical protein